MGEVGAVVVAAGRSTRMGGTDKVLASLGNRPVLWYSLVAFEACIRVDRIVVVTAAERLSELRDVIERWRFAKPVAVCEGGARRQDSVRAGLERLGGLETVVVHDGARPFVSAEMIEAGLAAVRETGAAVAAIPVADTLKKCDAAGNVLCTVPREGLWAVQTPQVFNINLLLSAHRRVTEDVTDDAAMIEASGGTVRVFLGSPRNIKITVPDDLLMARALLAQRTAAGEVM